MSGGVGVRRAVLLQAVVLPPALHEGEDGVLLLGGRQGLRERERVRQRERERERQGQIEREADWKVKMLFPGNETRCALQPTM